MNTESDLTEKLQQALIVDPDHLGRLRHRLAVAAEADDLPDVAYRTVGGRQRVSEVAVLPVKSDGSMGGYLGGLDAKATLLELEAPGPTTSIHGSRNATPPARPDRHR